MPNSIKYSTTGDTQSLKKGNFYFGVGDVGKGPSSATTYYNGSTPVASGYTIYSFDASQTSRISYASPTTDSEFISITNAKSGQNFTGVTQCLNWCATQTDYVCVNRDYEGIITNGLILNLDAGFTPSYTTSGTTWYDLSYSGNNGTLVNSPSFTNSSGGGITFDGIDDAGTLSSNIVLTGEFTICLWHNLTTGSNSDSLNRRTILSRSNGTSRLQFGNNVGGFTTFNDSSVGVSLTTYKNPGPTNAIITGSNFNYVVRRNSSDLTQQFINGVMLENIFTNQGTIGGTFTLNTIGRLGSSGRFYYGTIYNMVIYNSALSDSEILQNFNAQKSRFGL